MLIASSPPGFAEKPDFTDHVPPWVWSWLRATVVSPTELPSDAGSPVEPTRLWKFSHPASNEAFLSRSGVANDDGWPVTVTCA